MICWEELNDQAIQTKHSKGFDTVSVQYQPIYFYGIKNTEDKNSYFQDLEKKSLPKIKWINVIHQPIKPMGKKSQNDFWLLIDMNLDFDLATHFNHTVWRDLIEITHWTGITLH